MPADRGAPDPMIATARKRWNRCSESEDPQRKRILTAKQFRAGDQWPTAIKIAREGGNAISGMPAQPPRPCLVVDRLSQPLRQTSNTIKNADFGFEVLPNGEGADTDTAQIFKGVLRRVQNEARGESPIEWAADGAIEGGIGWFRILTEYAHETWDGDQNDPAVFDQEVRIGRITNNLAVYCDPSAMRPTRSDAQFAFVTEDLDKDEFIRLYPKADIRGLEEFMGTGDMVGWVSDDTIRIAEYWRIEYTERSFYKLKNGTITEDKPKDEESIDQTRIMRVPTVKCDKINAVESLESYEWLGSRIPLIPVLGEELNVDGTPILRGIIEPGMDAQRMINYTYSGAMEIFALAGRKAPMIPAASIANYKQIWDTRTIYNYSNLPYDVYDDQGRQLPPPTLDVTEAPIQAAVSLMQVSEESVKATTNTGDPSLGNYNPREHSGRAIQSLQAQSDLANSNYPDNVRRAVIYAAQLMMEIIPKITRPGQLVHILGMDDQPEQVIVGQPFQKGPNGVPQPSPDGITPELAQMSGGLHKFYDLNNGSYAVTVTVGKATSTKREEGAAALGDLIPHLPPEMQAIATPEYVNVLSFPGAQKLSAMLKKALPPQFQDSENGQPPLPPEVQQQMQQMQQQLQQAQQIIQTDQVKQQGKLQAIQAKAQGDLQLAQFEAEAKMRQAQFEADKEVHLQQMKDAAGIEEARINAAKAAYLQDAAAQEERLSTGLEQAHELGMAGVNQAHDQNMANIGQQHAIQQQAMQPPPQPNGAPAA